MAREPVPAPVTILNRVPTGMSTGVGTDTLTVRPVPRLEAPVTTRLPYTVALSRLVLITPLVVNVRAPPIFNVFDPREN